MGADEVTSQCKYILRLLSKTRPATITVREIMRLCKKFKTAESLTAPISQLCEYDYLREKFKDYGGTGRPQARMWDVNPMAYEIQF